jgi:signal transduction histidine kinase
VQRLEHKLAGNERLLPIVARMQRSVVRIDNMIRDFLDVSRVSAGRTLSLEREPCCLIDVVRNAIDELTPLYRGHLQLGGTERAYGMWDYDSMRRLIDNLVGNAIKYGDGARPITVGLRHEGNNAVLVVHNFGNVIPAEKRTDLFDRFTRLDGALERGAQGWGIGLRLVAAIAAAYDGSVQLRSEPDEGTTFSVILPILRPSTQLGDYGAIDAAAEPATDAIAKKRPSRPS